MAFDVDPDQAVSIVAIFLFIDAAFVGFPLLAIMVDGSGLPIIGLLIDALILFLLTRPSTRAKFGVR